MPAKYFSFSSPLISVFALFLIGVNSAAAQEIVFVDGYEQEAQITSFIASEDTIMQGETTTISWTTVGATSCTPSGGTGDWDMVSIDLPDGSAQIEFPDAGGFTFTMTCTGLFNQQAFANAVVTASPVPAVITSFIATPNSIAEGDKATLSWTTDFATSCTPSDGTGSWGGENLEVPDGSVEVNFPAADSYTFTLTCQGAVGSPAVDSLIVTVSPAAVITSFEASSTSIAERETTTFSWDTENVTSCAPSNGAGGWGGENISVPSGSAEIEISNAGDYTFMLTCQGVAGTPAIATEDVLVSVPAEITSFATSSDTAIVGETITLSWDTANATSCTPTNGVDGWENVPISLPDGTHDIEFSTQGDHTFTLTCDGVAGPAAVAEQTVSVSADPNVCSTPPLGTNPTWIDPWEQFWLEFFPNPVSDHRFARIAIEGWYALEFETGNIVDDGKLSTIETTVTDGVRLGSISVCPGEFDVADECRFSWGIGGGIRWATNGRVGACQLESNTTYYFNVTYTDGIDPDTTTCNSVPCITNYEHSNRSN